MFRFILGTMAAMVASAATAAMARAFIERQRTQRAAIFAFKLYSSEGLK